MNNLIADGATVYSSDGEKLGEVIAATANYVVIEKGFFFPKDYYIPMSAIADRDGDNVTLNVTKDQALAGPWDEEPADFRTAVVVNGYEADAVAAPLVASDVPIVAETDSLATDARYAATASAGTDQDTIAIPVREEELIATTRAEEIGSVRVEKVVTEEERTLEAPVSEERVRVTRRVVDRVEGVGAAPDAFEETVIEVPLYGEDVDVSKRTRIIEEVDIAKEAVASTRQVTGTVRREDVRITDDVSGGVEGVIDENTAVIDPSSGRERINR